MLHKEKKKLKKNHGKKVKATGSSKSVSRKVKPARSASFLSLTSWLSKKMLFSWEFPGEISKWNNETQNRNYTWSHMEVERVSCERKKKHIIRFVLDFFPGPVLETDVWVVCTWGWRALLVLMLLRLLTNCCKNGADWVQRQRSRRPGLGYTQLSRAYY